MPAHSPRRGSVWVWLIAILALIGLAAVLLRSDRREIVMPPYHALAIYDVEILHRGGKPAVLATGADGKPVPIACSTCHSTATPPAHPDTPGVIFHQGLAVRHGGLTCTSCHDAGSAYDGLRLADSRPIAYSEAMRLCSQCHGPQARDYAAGAHGGMMGFWDLSKGGRQRHACTTCHDPHSPAYPHVRPAPRPNDRFLIDEHSHE